MRSNRFTNGTNATMKRRRKICEQCRFFFSGAGEHTDSRYAFCMNTDLHGDSSFYEFIARENPENCPENRFFDTDYGENVFDECPYMAEHMMVDINEETT